MARIHAYLNFNGTCKEAFDFYAAVFNTTVKDTYFFGDMPADPNRPMAEEDKGKVMHTALKINDNTMLMGSDCLEAFGHKAVAGTNTYIMVDVDTAAEAHQIFEKLSVNAQNMEMPLGEQFFAELYASFTDQYGISWMIHFEGNRAQQH